MSNKFLTICIVLENNPFFSNSASSNRWRTLIEGLLKQNEVRVQLIITKGYNNFSEWKAMGIRGTYLGYSYQYTTPLVNNNIWLRRINKYILESFINKWNNFYIKRLLKLNPADIIWTSTDIGGFKLATQLKQQGNKAKLLLEMSEFLDIHLNDKANVLIKKLGDERQHFFENNAFYAYDFIVLMTKTLYKHYEGFPGLKPKLLHLPMTVDLSRFNKEQNGFSDKFGLQKPYIVYVGVMSNAKDGVDILIDAFSIVEKEYPELHLYLFGSYHYDSPGHTSQIKCLGLEEKIFYKGLISRDEIPGILMNAELLVLPRPDSKQAQGGFPTKLGEYLASGRPVCATKVGEIPDYLEDEVSAFLAEPGSVDSFADAMLRALTDKKKAAEVGSNGRMLAKKSFNMDVQSKILYNFLAENISAKS
jgi:glycosyltransferase involved in cell wall biosynthesis